MRLSILDLVGKVMDVPFGMEIDLVDQDRDAPLIIAFIRKHRVPLLTRRKDGKFYLILKKEYRDASREQLSGEPTEQPTDSFDVPLVEDRCGDDFSSPEERDPGSETSKKFL